jgi:hypothetical protein
MKARRLMSNTGLPAPMGDHQRRLTDPCGRLALSSDRGGIERTHQCAGVLLQNVTVDILDSVKATENPDQLHPTSRLCSSVRSVER